MSLNCLSARWSVQTCRPKAGGSSGRSLNCLSARWSVQTRVLLRRGDETIVSIAFRLDGQFRLLCVQHGRPRPEYRLNCLSARWSVQTRKRIENDKPLRSQLPFGSMVSSDPRPCPLSSRTCRSQLPFGSMVSSDTGCRCIRPIAIPVSIAFRLDGQFRPCASDQTTSASSTSQLPFGSMVSSDLLHADRQRQARPDVSIAFRLDGQFRRLGPDAPKPREGVSIAFRLDGQFRLAPVCRSHDGAAQSQLPFGSMVSSDTDATINFGVVVPWRLNCLSARWSVQTGIADGKDRRRPDWSQLPFGSMVSSDRSVAVGAAARLPDASQLPFGSMVSSDQDGLRLGAMNIGLNCLSARWSVQTGGGGRDNGGGCRSQLPFGSMVSSDRLHGEEWIGGRRDVSIAFRLDGQFRRRRPL